MNRVLSAFALSAVLCTPLAAQDIQLSGTVAEAFGSQIVVTTSEGRLLVTLPEGTAAPAPGTRLDLTGTRSGDTFAATTLNQGPAAAEAGQADAALPVGLRDLGLTEIRTRHDDDGDTYTYARMPSGGWLRAESRGDRLVEVQADGTGLPEAMIRAMLPDTVRAEPRLADIVRVTEIDHDDDGDIKVEGYAADGMRIEMEFRRDGTLDDYDRERDDRRSLSEEAARERLTALGYTGIGYIERGGRHVTALAVNSHGDEVEVRLDDQGQVERERRWQN